MEIIRQNLATRECLAATSAAMLLDWPCKTCSLADLVGQTERLKAGALPIGSVEFVREAMRIGGVAEPEPLSYPLPLAGYLGRSIRLGVAAQALSFDGFVKPVRTKLFTGFVNRRGVGWADEHVQEQLEALLALDDSEPVWLAESVDFAGEWRAYVVDGRILSMERYDPDGMDGVEPPEAAWVLGAMAAWEASGCAPKAYSLDIGRLSTGALALVEANDAWALGLYGRSLSDKSYVGMLASRWKQLWEQSLVPRMLNGSGQPRP